MGPTIPIGIEKGKSLDQNEYLGVVYPKVISGLNRGMEETEKAELSEIRRRNITLLILGRFDNNKAEFARAIERAPAQVNNFLNPNGKKNIGESLARHIERKLDLEKGLLDRRHEELPPVIDNEGLALIVEEPRQFPVRGGAIAVDQLDVRASMGSGAPLPEREPIIDSIRVPVDYIRENFPTVTSPANLKIITGFGNSMEPTFKHGDPLIVDTGVNAMDVDTVYVFAYQNELYIKGIQRMPDRSIKVISHNRAIFDPFVLDAKQREDVTVIGRVVCAVNMNKIS
jgi:phage repressor protein C with HTH and peptisase S24 domain